MGVWITENIVPFLELLAFTITASALIYGLIATRLRWMKWTLTNSRKQGFAKAGFTRIKTSDIRSRVDALCDLEDFHVAGEVNWLCSLLSNDATKPSTITELLDKQSLSSLADAYDDHRARLNRRILLTSEQVPLIGQAVKLATDTATYLRTLSAGESNVTASNFRISLPNRSMTIDFVAFPDPSKGIHAFDLVVSYRRHLVVPDQGPNPWLYADTFSDRTIIPTSEPEQQRLTERFTTGRNFDGILPRLIGASVERDSGSGRSRLRVSLSACTYSSVVLDHYPAADQVKQYLGSNSAWNPVARGVREGEFVHGHNVGLLTLSMNVITSDGYIALPRRSRIIGSHEDRYGASVNGNLELQGRKGIALDLDEYGIPDPKLALAREAKEELGLAVDPDSITITGLIRFDAPTERGTNVLLGITRSHFSLEEFVLQMHHSDPVEGVWEIGSDILGIRIPTNQSDFDLLARWLTTSGELTPHATAASIAAMVTSTKFSISPELDLNSQQVTNFPSHLIKKVTAGTYKDVG